MRPDARFSADRAANVFLQPPTPQMRRPTRRNTTGSALLGAKAGIAGVGRLGGGSVLTEEPNSGTMLTLAPDIEHAEHAEQIRREKAQPRFAGHRGAKR